MVDGENIGDWGDKTNTNLRGIEEAICQTNNVTFAGTATVALSITDFSDPPQIGRGFRLNLTGTGTAGQILQVPDIQKSYIINNGLAVDTTVKNSTSSPTVLVPAGKSAFVYSVNSAGVTNAINTFTSSNVVGTFEISGNASVGGTLNIGTATTSKNISADGSLNVSGDFSAGGTTNLSTAVMTGTLSVGSNASVGGTLNVTGSAGLAGNINLGNATADTVVVGGVLTANASANFTGNVGVVGTHTVTGYYKNSSGNLIIEPTSYIAEIRGGGSTDGAVQLNCRNNSHGQRIKAQPHSEGVDNTMLLPKSADSTLVSEVATQTLTNKTFGDTSVDGTFNISSNASVGGTFNVTGSAGLAGNVNIGNATADETTIASQVAFQNNLRERTSINTTSATGTINFDILSHNVELRTNDAAANFELNFRGNASTAFSATVAVGQTTSFAFESSMGSTAYYLTAIKIDGATASPVHWQGGTTAPSEGNAAGIDSYLVNITRGADGGSGTAQYTCLASQTQFGKVTY